MNAIIQIALNTYRESVRGKVLYTLLFFGVALVFISAIFGAVTIGDQVKIIKDFGLMSISLFSVILTVISGASLLHKEIYRKTAYNILSKPVHRWQFLAGKQLGLLMTVTMMIALMTAGLMIFVYLFNQELDLLLIQAAIFINLELVIITAIAIFFSTVVVTPALAGLFTFSIFVAGRSVEYIPELMKVATPGEESSILKIIYWVLPHLDKLSISNSVVYGIGASASQFGWALCYSFTYSISALIIASVIFRGRNLT